MKLSKITDGCENKNCPAVYETDRGTMIVQGHVITDPQVLAQLGLSEDESAVEVPADMLKEARLVSE